MVHSPITNMLDILINNHEEIENRRNERDQALINFQKYESSLGYIFNLNPTSIPLFQFTHILTISDKLDNVERFLFGTQKGIDSMNKHVVDESYDSEKVIHLSFPVVSFRFQTNFKETCANRKNKRKGKSSRKIRDNN